MLGNSALAVYALADNPNISIQPAATGSAATISVGTVSVEAKATVNVTGNGTTVSVGDENAFSGSLVFPNGQEVTASVGATDFIGEQVLLQTGNEATAQVGQATAYLHLQVEVTGLQMEVHLNEPDEFRLWNEILSPSPPVWVDMNA